MKNLLFFKDGADFVSLLFDIVVLIKTGKEEEKAVRLFLAALLEDTVKDRLCEAMEQIRQSTKTSRLTRRENLHLTLVFLGETERLKEIREAMGWVSAAPFSLGIQGIGRFRRDGGDIYWAGVTPNPCLLRLYEELKKALTVQGFSLEDRPYRPHLTLARQVEKKPEIPFQALKSSLKPVSTRISAVSLMKSERIGGTLVYTELYRKELGDNERKDAIV